MKIAAITRVRNESHIINDVLDHVSDLPGVHGIYVYDDCSTDSTANIAQHHPAVVQVIRGTTWASDPDGRNLAEGNLRTAALRAAQKDNPEWIYCFDADEFADFEGIDFSADAYRLRLFDFYITPEDVHKAYEERQWMGPEYRDILMLFRNQNNINFYQREPTIPGHYRVAQGGWVKHYGKAISVEDFEKTCDYYINYRGGSKLPQFTEKWRKRKGKAIHTQSDFGRPLITWGERIEKGLPLSHAQAWD